MNGLEELFSDSGKKFLQPTRSARWKTNQSRPWNSHWRQLRKAPWMWWCWFRGPTRRIGTGLPASRAYSERSPVSHHQKSYHVPYYIDILLNCLGMFNLGIISTFFTLRSYLSTWNDFLQLITSKYLIKCPNHHIFGWLLMSHKKSHLTKILLESIIWDFLVAFLYVS